MGLSPIHRSMKAEEREGQRRREGEESAEIGRKRRGEGSGRGMEWDRRGGEGRGWKRRSRWMG